MTINKAVEGLRAGEVIITPSESCYGFSCDAFDLRAVAKINELKGRQNMSMTILIANLKQLEQFAHVDNELKALSLAFHPGPLNIIVDLIDPQKYSYLSTNGLAFRIPKNNLLLDLIHTFDAPITTTSTNKHGEPAIYDVDEVKKQFGELVYGIIDDGDLDDTVLPSTVFDARTNKILRQGPVTLEQIRAVLLKISKMGL